IGGGGRYDDLTGMFGLKDLTGVGVSFGADRIYDVLEELNLFPESSSSSTQVLIANFGDETYPHTLPLLSQLRDAGVSAEFYPVAAKLKKQMGYADGKRSPYVLLVGEEEVASASYSLTDVASGAHREFTLYDLITFLS